MNFNELFDFIDLIKNPDKYLAKLEELNSYNESIKANIALSDDVNDIETAKKMALDALNKNNEILAKAQTEARKIVDDARVVYDKKFQDLGIAQRAAEETTAKNKQQEIAMNEQMTSLTKDQKALNDVRIQLEQERKQLAQLQTEVSERLDKLKSVMG
jgi:DNA repair exonuclease SbcCD ATPase subunit